MKPHQFEERNGILVPRAGGPAPFREAAGITVDEDDEQWRRLSGDGRRDLTPMTQRRMQKLAYYVWESNLLANRLIELPVAYLLAEGVSLRVDDEDAQAVLKRHWNDPTNEWDIKMPKRVRELSLFGEQCWPAFVNEYTGHVKIGYLDPCLIETVVTDPDNREQPIGLITTKDSKGRARRFKIIVNGEDQDCFTGRTCEIRDTFTDGECFYFKINDLCSSTRGRSDLLAQLDWLDGYDRFLFGQLDRSEFLRAFIWDVTLKGADEAQVDAKANKIKAPAPGSVRVHNDSEEWSAETPSFGEYESAAGARLFRNHILGGATVPEHWFGGAEDVNRATGESMGEPTLKILKMRQKYLGYMLTSVGKYQLRQVLKLSGFPIDNTDLDLLSTVRAEFPEMTARDTTKYASALQQVTVAAALSISEGFITRETATRQVQAMSEQLGVPFDVEAEIAGALKETGKRREEDTFTGDLTSTEDDAVTA